MNDEFLYTYDDSYEDEFKKDIQHRKIQYEKKEEKISIRITGTENRFNLARNRHFLKENLFLTAINNLLIKNNYLQLTLQLEEDQITEDEYDKEIDNNPDNYILKIDSLEDKDELLIINEIIKKIGRQFTVDEVADLFSKDPIELEQAVAKLY